MSYDTLIIDGNNLAHRCYHTYSLSTNGQSVSITFGVLKSIQMLMNKFKPKSIVVCWDGGVPEFRRVAVPEYKANRHTNDDPAEYEDMVRQMQELSDYALPMMGILSIRKTGAEADDLMYHAGILLDGMSLVITNDKDLLQAVSETVHVYNPSKDFVYTLDNFEEQVGINRKQYVEWRALQGDGSDNIRGVEGIGEKTATKLFKHYRYDTNIFNDALGIFPGESILSDRLKSNILSFGFTNFLHNLSTMALWADRVGARRCIIAGIDAYMQYDRKRVIKYIMRNAFVSLLDTLPSMLNKLSKPALKPHTFRTATTITRRFPVNG